VHKLTTTRIVEQISNQSINQLLSFRTRKRNLYQSLNLYYITLTITTINNDCSNK
jgi:hypothetical protein